ncbi:MAG: 2-oxo acid dehydrogenase subunit E2 [Candidatus Nanohaloarchaeota archaeon QJJ-7]|nr:2-oxo acid dehydrogenase subunit E2 [Candidatus Nanohaloarchaeota archaeon QJJ-7]
MMREFEFPDVGEGVTEGTLIEWMVDSGDEVEEDESLAEVETDKAVVEVPSPTDGTIQELKAEEGETIKVGEVIVVLAEDGDESGETGKRESKDDGSEGEPEESGSTSVVGELEEEGDEEEPAEDKTSGKVLASPSTRRLAREKDVEISTVEGSGPGGRITREDVVKAAEGGESEEVGEESGGGKVLATPAVRHLAEEEGVDISGIEGSGPGGRVTEEDVKEAAEEGVEREEAVTDEKEVETFGSSGQRFAPEDRDFEKWGDVEREEVSGTRRSIAKQMERSKYTAPHVTATDDADVTELVSVREKEKENAEEEGVKLTFLPFVAKAVISALRDYPRLNASLDERTGELVLKDYYNIGIAVATDDGLLVPNVKNADQKSILEIAEEINDLAGRARERELDLEEMQGGTFTISNWGSIGGKYGSPIINYPEVGILGTGVIEEKPVAVDGQVVVRNVMPLSMTFDHRVVDGAYAAQFMNELVTHLEDPDLLMMD